MSIILKLPPDLENELAAEAERFRLPLSEYAACVLATGRTATDAPKTGAKLVAYWRREGVIGTRPDIMDSRKRTREIRWNAEKRT
jgi:hypothetical protein